MSGQVKANHSKYMHTPTYNYSHQHTHASSITPLWRLTIIKMKKSDALAHRRKQHIALIKTKKKQNRSLDNIKPENVLNCTEY